MGGFSTIGGDRASVVIVAASDTPYKLKARADYVCTGTNTTGRDENVINMALQEGKAVLLLPGTYWLSGPILPDSDQMLIGSGMSTVLKLRDNHNANVSLISVNGKSNVVIRDLVVDGNSGNQISGNVCGINVSNVEYSKVINSVVENGNYNLYLLYSSNNVLVGNVVRNATTNGFIVRYNSNSNIISKNFIFNNVVNGLYILDDCTMNIISDNILIGNSSGFANIRLNAKCSYNLIANNKCRHNNVSRYGIMINSSDCVNNIIHGNDLYSSGLDGDIYDAGTNTRRRDNIGNNGDWLTDA